MRRRVLAACLLVCALVVVAWSIAAQRDLRSAVGPGLAADDVCAPLEPVGAVAGASLAPDASRERAGSIGSFLTGGGTYVPRVRCMVNEAGETDWPWVITLIVLNIVVVAGYARIFVFLRRAYLRESPGDRNTKLMDLAWVFLLCGICSYGGAAMMFFWPAYRLLAICLVPLALFTVRFCVRLEDVSASFRAKRLERELEEAKCNRTAELEAQIEARTAELREARDAATAANEAKSAFIAAVSHEIRTPLNAVLGYSALLAEEGHDDRSRGEFAGVVRRNGDHLATVIDDVLDMAKIESKRLEIERVPCLPWQIVCDVVSLLRPKAEAKGLAISCAINGPAPVSVIGDPTRLRQVLLNLTNNAVKFTERGAVRVEMSASGDGDACTLRFDVIDTGIGLTPDQCETVFEPFSQAEPGTSRRYGGTGLGLSISRALAELMGGAITVRSEPGRGSAFTAVMSVGLPEGAAWEACQSAHAGADQPAPERVRLSGRALIVDDSPDNRRLLNVFLRGMGLSCDEAENGRDAVNMAASAEGAGEPYDLVLMDLDMPICDGETAMKRIKAATPGRIVVALTAHTIGGVRERLLDAGFDDYEPKPIRRGRLERLCVRWIGDDGTRDAA